MDIDRRTFILAASSLFACSAADMLNTTRAEAMDNQKTTTTRKTFRRIATEEAFSIPPVARGLKQVARTTTAQNLDLNLIRNFYDDPPPDSFRGQTLQRLLDLDVLRLKSMDENNVNMHLLSLTAPGGAGI